MFDQVVPFISIGVGIDPTADDDVTSTVGDNAILSNTAQLYDAY